MKQKQTRLHEADEVAMVTGTPPSGVSNKKAHVEAFLTFVTLNMARAQPQSARGWMCPCSALGGGHRSPSTAALLSALSLRAHGDEVQVTFYQTLEPSSPEHT